MTPAVVPLPASGDVFLDAHRPDKGLRVSWHDAGTQATGGRGDIVVLSLWRGNTCTGTLHLAPEEVPRLIATLATGLSESCASRPRRGQAS